MKRHVLITGGTGLVGSSIVRRLIASDRSVTVLSRRPPTLPLAHVRWVHGDLAIDTEAVLRQLPVVDEVVHAAAAIHDMGDVDSLSVLSCTNIRASESLFGWCADRGVQRVVMIGSLSVLRRPLCVPITELHPVGPSSPYAMSKLWNEEQLLRRSREAHFTPIILRIASPIPTAFEAIPTTVVKTWIEAAMRGGPLRVFGSGSRTQDFVSCVDVAEAVHRSLDLPDARGIYHIGSGVALSMHDLAKTIAQFRNTPIIFEGDDPNEDDRWNLALDRARNELTYVPQQTGQEVIAALARMVL
jgi:UDP-glucose 4-epimerase